MREEAAGHMSPREDGAAGLGRGRSVQVVAAVRIRWLRWEEPKSKRVSRSVRRSVHERGHVSPAAYRLQPIDLPFL